MFPMKKSTGRGAPWMRRAAVAALFITTPLAALAQPMPAEVKVGTAVIIDHEFDWGRDGVYCQTCNYGAGNSRFSYIDRDHNLWVGYVDFYTGNFLPADGRAVLVDTNAVAPVEIGNGPEWTFSARGSELVYTRWTDGQAHTPMSMNVGFARMGGGSWLAGTVEGTDARVMPVGTMDVDDATPAVHYQNVAIGNIISNLFWRDIVPQSTVHQLPIYNNDPGMTRRWVPGTRDIIITAPAVFDSNGTVYKQVFLYNTATGVMKQLTFDAGHKLWAFMFQAPEYDNENVFFVMVNGTQLDVYRNFPRPNAPRGQGDRWRVVNTINGPPTMPYISSPEPFVHNGHSYIFFSVTANSDLHEFAASAIAITGIDTSVQPMRLLTTDDNPPRARRDPEYFITANGPYIYYNRYLLATASSPQISEGMYRVDTGLGPRLP